MRLKEQNPVLIVIDVQKAFEHEAYWGGNRNNKKAEVICGKLLDLWREKSLPIIHIRHSSLDPNSLLHATNPGFEFSEQVIPLDHETIITKQVNSAFIGTDLKQKLDEQNLTTVVIVGLTTNHCVSTTTRMAGNYGYETYVISDATATFDRKGINGKIFDAELIHQTALASLNGEFANVLSYNELMNIF